MAGPSTYITYASGIEAKKLHLGNLVHDFKKPNEYEPYIEAAYKDVTESAPEWVEATTLENYALTLGKEGRRYQVVAAAKGVKLEIKDPSNFFTSHTIPTATTWLTTHLSASLPLTPKPQLWLLTGLILLIHSTWSSISVPATSASEGKFIPGKQAPFHTEGVEKMRRLSVSEDVKPVVGFLAGGDGKDGVERTVEGVKVMETGKFPGTRAWAVRWERVEVGLGEKGEEGAVVLKGAGKGRVVVVRLDEDGVAEEGDEGDEMGEEYWDKFLDGVDALTT